MERKTLVYIFDIACFWQIIMRVNLDLPVFIMILPVPHLFETVLIYSPGWPRTLQVYQNCLQLIEISLVLLREWWNWRYILSCPAKKTHFPVPVNQSMSCFLATHVYGVQKYSILDGTLWNIIIKLDMKKRKDEWPSSQFTTDFLNISSTNSLSIQTVLIFPQKLKALTPRHLQILIFSH